MTTPNLKFPIWAAAQDQPWLPENETKNLIDALMPGVVLSDTLTTPPAAPVAGACYIVATPATGAWAGWENKIAAYIGGAWVEISPQEGWVFWVVSNTGRSAYTGGAWVATVEEAPSDGTAYARQSGGWAAVSLAGGMCDMEVTFSGAPTASQVIFSRLLGRNAEFAANFSGSVGKIGVNPAATFDLDVQADGVSIGTISISTGGVFSFSMAGVVVKNVLAGTVVEVVAPVGVDATAADISIQLIANSDGGVYESTGASILAITNAGAETGDMTGWAITGAFGVTGVSGWLVPFEGSWVFYGGASATSSASQIVDIDPVSIPKITTGAALLDLSWQQNSYAGNDQGDVEIEFLDAAGASLGAAVGLGMIATAGGVWTLRGHVGVAIPVAARKVKITMRAVRVQGTVADAYFDALAADIY